MVRNYYYFALLILIWVQNSVDAINFKGIHDINSIKKFIQGITDRTPAEYYFGKVLSDSEKSKIIVDDLVGLLSNLNDLTDRHYNASRELSLRFNTFKDNSLKKNVSVFNFMDPLNSFDNIASKINSLADIFIKLQNDFGYDLSKYCSAISEIRQSLAQEKKGSIVIEYNRAKDLQGVFYSNGRVSTGPDDYISCGKRVLFGKLFNDFYLHMVTSYLKEYVIRYYLDIINAQCLDQNLSSAKIDEFIFISRLQREISSMKHKQDTTDDYLWRCDPPSYDNSNGTLYYEMTHMLQTVIVKEEDLDIHQSCSHNCDTRYIEDSMNYTECDGYQDCQYIDSSYEICEPPASDHSLRRYQWFKDEHGKVYGDNSTECKTPVKKVSSTLWVSKLRSCDYCLCNCIKKKPSMEDDVLFISFREQVTDIERIW
ncbi:uncharacterized protein LOC123271636 isoform X1 [Cotesia glomerata]|uniref:uncharacterized protein LOC123271636 isoform X1 n=1 Tax=Cotesia glomerata TaxID=32391 RepID=UPI001D017B99|nr:uncharacterized protein LOC123271636 isoform X1 [Cotesia glomerata]